MAPPPLRSACSFGGLLVLFGLGFPAAAQIASGGDSGATPAAAPTDSVEIPVEIPPPRPTDLDARVFYAVYDVQDPLFEGTMRAVNGVSLPIFFAVVPVLGTAALLTEESEAPATRILLSEAGALGFVALGKFTLRRARPFVALPDVAPRQRRPPSGLDPYSFPSGHSAMAFALATSVSLSYPEWYVIAPAYAWASATALARVWFGMHYPTDIAVGAVAGAGSAALVHALLAGGGEDPPSGEAAVPVIAVRFGL